MYVGCNKNNYLKTGGKPLLNSSLYIFIILHAALKLQW